MKRRRQGATLVEVVVAAGLSTIALFGAVFLFLSGAMSWARGTGRIDAESGANLAVRSVSRELREAMTVTVDSDGAGLSYRLPAKDEDGSFTTPVTWDGVDRRIELQGSQLCVTGSGQTRVICRGVVATDPLSNSTYRIFTAGSGAITRSLTVMIASSRNAEYNKMATSRSRETIYLRNIPQLVK